MHNDRGVIGLQHRCSKPLHKPCGTAASWTRLGLFEWPADPAVWTNIIYDDFDQYVCGFQVRAGQQFYSRMGSPDTRYPNPDRDHLGVWDVRASFCENEWEQVGFLKDSAALSSQAWWDGYPSNPFKTEPWSTNTAASQATKTCVRTGNGGGGEWWRVDFDGGAVDVASVAILNCAGATASSWLAGVEVHVDTTLCHTVPSSPADGDWVGFACSATGSSLSLRQ